MDLEDGNAAFLINIMLVFVLAVEQERKSRCGVFERIFILLVVFLKSAQLLARNYVLVWTHKLRAQRCSGSGDDYLLVL